MRSKRACHTSVFAGLLVALQMVLAMQSAAQDAGRYLTPSTLAWRGSRLTHLRFTSPLARGPQTGFHPRTTVTNDIWLGGAGNWNNAALWSTGVPAITNSVLIDNGNPVVSTVTLNVNGVANTLTIDSGDALSMNNATVLTIGGGSISNAGTLSMNSTGNNTDLVLDANTTLSGGGTLTMSNNTHNFIFGNATAVTLTNQETIQGAGNIGDGEMTLVNSGTINANQPSALTIQTSGGTTNTGLLEATGGGTLGFTSTTVNNAGGTINTSGGAFSASNATISSGTLRLAGGAMVNSTINGATVTVGGAGDLQLINSVIENGTLNNSATIETVGGFGSVLGSTVTNTATGVIQIDNNTGLSFQAGTVNNAGAITLNSTGNNTELGIDGNVTLAGAGTLTMSNKTQNIILGAATADTLTNQQTIQGAGNIGNNVMTLVNSGTIDANQSNALTIQANGGTTNMGLLEATAGGTLGFLNTTVTNAGGAVNTSAGAISASNTTINGGTVTLAGGGMTNSTISGATVTVGGTGDLQLNNGVIENGTLNNSATIDTVSGFGSVLGSSVTNTAAGAIRIDNNTGLSFQAGTVNNAGAITLNSSGNNTELGIEGNVTLTGAGTVTLSNKTQNIILGAATGDTLTNQQTIQGAGNIGNNVMTLVNSGTIDANQSNPLTIQANGGTTNTGTLEATAGGTLGFVNTTVNNAGGTVNTSAGAFSASNTTINGGSVTLAGGGMTSSTINGATVTVGGTGDLQLNNGSIINGTLNNSATIETVSSFGSVLGNGLTNTASGVIKIDNNTGLSFQAGTVNNAGAITLNSTGNNTELGIQGNVTLTGAGTVTLSNRTQNIILGAATGDTLTNQQTIQGAGNIGNNVMTLINSGTINANQSNPLTIEANGGTTNTGTLEATAGGTLGFLNTTVNNAGGTVNTSAGAISASNTTINGGTVTLAGGGMTSTTISGATVTVGGTGDLQLNNGSIINGTLNNSATIETVSSFGSVLGNSVTNTATGVIQIDNNTGLSFQAGTVNNAGAITLNSTGNNTELGIDGNVTLTGAGTVTLSNKTQNIILGAATGDTLTNQQTIQGAGNIGNNVMTLVNSGTINANQSNPLTIEANGGTTNTGMLEATAGGTLGFSGTTVNNAGGTVNTSAGAFSASNTTINGGTVTLAGGGMISSTINGATVTVGGTGDLQLNNGSIINGSLNNSATIETVSSFGSVLGSSVTNTASGVIQIDNNTGLSFQAGTVNNAGAITLNSTGNNTELGIDGNVTLTGPGTLTMSNKTQNIILGAATADTLTNQETIQGAGNIGNNVMTLVNSGLINANQSNALTIQANGGTTNTGMLEATAGGTLGFVNTTVTNTGGTVNTSAGAFSASNTTINGGTVTLAGGGMTSSTISGATVTVGGTGDLQLNNSSIINGTLNNSATIETVSSFGSVLGGSVTNTASGAIKIDNNTGLSFQAGTVNNAGTISLNSTGNNTELAIQGNVTLSGAGTLTMSNKGQNLIFGAATADTLTNQETIEGSGNIGDNVMTLINAGTINANQSTQLTIAANGGFTNKGTLVVGAGDTMQISNNTPFSNFSGTTLTGGGYNVTGTLEFANANIVTNNANITLNGANSQILSNTGANALANFAVNGSSGTFTLGPGRSFTTAANFTNSGKLVVGSGDTFKVAGSLTNFSGTTLTGGNYAISGTLQFGAAGSTSILTDSAQISLGTGGQIVDLGGNNALAGLDLVSRTGSLALDANYGTYTTAGRFTNNGVLAVGSGDSFVVNGNLTNFASGTLTGGTFDLTGTLQFNNAAIATNASKLTLSGGSIVNQSGTNALLGLTTNTGTFALSRNASFATTGGSFTNSGTFTVNTGSTFTVGGSSFNFTQTAGTTTVDGTLTSSSLGTVNLNGGSLFGAGTLADNVVDSGTLTPGDSATKTAKLTVSDTYTQSTTGALDISIGGTGAGTTYDQLKVTQTAAVGGTLNLSLVNGFTPTVGQTFVIVSSSALSGTFATVNGLAINSNEHFTVTYGGSNVILKVVSGALPASTFTASDAMRPGLLAPGGHSAGGRGRYAPAVSLRRIVAIPAPALGLAPGLFSGAGIHGFHRMDEAAGAGISDPSTAAAGPGAASSLGLATLSALSYNGMAAMNHKRFECGVDLKALLKTSRKQLLRGLWASPDSPNALNLGYMIYTGSH